MGRKCKEERDFYRVGRAFRLAHDLPCPAAKRHKSVFPFGKKMPFTCFKGASILRVVFACLAGDCFSACSAGATAQPLAAGCLLVAMPLRDSSYPVGAVPPYGWGVPLAGKITFLPAQQGPKPLFLLSAKEKAVLDSEKEKVDQWKSWGGAVQQDGGPILLGCSSGKILWAILLSSAACV